MEETLFGIAATLFIIGCIMLMLLPIFWDKDHK